MPLIPMVVQRSPEGERAYDIYSRLLKDRIVFLGTEVMPESASLIISQLLYLDAENQEDIWLYINSPGGSVVDGLAIVDTMQFLKSPVNTVCMGGAYSMGAVIMACGTNGKRWALPHSRVLLHQPWGSMSGQEADIDIQAKELKRLKGTLYNLLAKATGQSVTKLSKDCDRDYILSAEDSVKYGLIDGILTKRS